MSELRLIQEENSVIELVVLDECFVLVLDLDEWFQAKVRLDSASGEPTFFGKFLRVEKVKSQANKPKPSSWKPDSTRSMG